MKVLIADDHAIVRRGLEQILEEEYETLTVGEAQNARDVLRLARSEHWDVFILDISMPGRSGLDVLKELKQLCPKTPALVLTMHSEEQYAIRVLRAGAAGYLNKEAAPEHLLEAIREVTRGRRYVSPAVADILAASIRRDADTAPHEALSDREFQVLRMIASGKTVGEIADEIALSVKTVSTYRTRILTKMAMKTNAELTHYAVVNGLVS